MFEQILDEIRQYDTIIIHRHKSPDGDAIGSQVGLKHILRDAFPEKTILAVGDPAGHYDFMADSVMDDVPDSAYENALAIVLDTSAKKLISDERYTTAKRTARIDHHIFVEKIADVEVTDTSAESCCSLITAFAMESGLPVSDTAATVLYTGMVTDSGRFRYDSTSAGTFRRAAFLMERNIDTNEIYRRLYASDFEQMKLRSQYVLKIQFASPSVTYIYTTLDELLATGADTFAISRGMVSVMNDIRGVDIWANFTETEQGVMCELRSGRYNINPIAVKYGGGGHAKASGATLPDRETAMRMLDDLILLAGEEQ